MTLTLALQAVIFNWKDSIQKDRILNQLSVLAEAAKSIDNADLDREAGSVMQADKPLFGHLHIVFRDWSFADSDGEAVKQDLFAHECSSDPTNISRSREAILRDHARDAILRAFCSVHVW